MKQRLKFAMLSLLVMTSCKPNEPLSAQDARQIADKIVAKEMSRTSLDKFEVDTVDLGGSWKLSYSIRGGSTGGPIVFVIDKRTGKIKDVKTWQ